MGRSRKQQQQQRQRDKEKPATKEDHGEVSAGRRSSALENVPTTKTWQRKYLLIALLGLISALVYNRRHVKEHLDLLDQTLQEKVKPQLEQLERELRSRLNESIPMSYLTQQQTRPGYHLAKKGAKANYPIVMVPGFVTSGLEVWGARECAKGHYRQRLWAAIGMARSILTERDCWKDHMMLDPYTGGDPEGIRIRAASGFEAADYFLANYWVFGKLIQNLADVGYDPSTMSMEPYDWRLAFPLLEERDGYFTKLKMKIEAMHKTTGKKVVLTSHSMGALVVHYFFAWVTTSESNGGGDGGKKWVDTHIHAYLNLAGVHLGVPKAASALLSGDMRDTAVLGTLGSVVEQIFGRRLRVDLFSTWGSLWAMLPKGGEALWGVGADMCETRSSEDPMCPSDELSPLLVMSDTPEERDVEREQDLVTEFATKQAHTTVDTIDFLRQFGGGVGPDISANKLHSFTGEEKPSSRTWHDPSRTPLPYAPNLKIYCFYGTGVDTERAYYYKRNPQSSDDSDQGDLPLIHDGDVFDADRRIDYGVRFVDGDGSVPLISLGYLCVDAWTRKDSGLNPSGAQILTREYKHEYEFVVDDPSRGGPRSSDHVDLLGNIAMTEDFLRVVTGFDVAKVETRLESDIVAIARGLNEHPKGGLWAKDR